MTNSVDITTANPVFAHNAIQQAWALGKALTTAGRKVRITAAEAEDDRTIQQNKFMWGPCLKEISEQAVLNGAKWTPDAWHEMFKRVFLGYEIVKVKVAGRKRATVIRRLRSTTGLSVRAMSNYLDELQAFAATEHGVRFSVRDWYEYAGIDRPAPRKKPQSQREEATA